ncbi:hypothetical protein LOTGIDRAFT_237879 [Lottia gigantea]|uniref:Uncharacterized protein n=1 Tax=Lottia gigantea TaxID=225164 RepID=V4CK84_LOTGI|nr:hypothetical protein LOTGIDRAFT_237879 [Lottia gigantea]ESP02645.1 hypothetical protein LOTGIDRAFT_237879 [Lottia gigantea]
MMIPGFLWKSGQFFGICLIVIQIQYAASQISEIPLTLDSILKQQGIQDAGSKQSNGFSTLSSGTPAFNHYSPERLQALQQSQIADFQSMLSMMSQQPSTSIAGPPQTQPGMEEMMRMLTQSFGQSAPPTPEQLGFTHYGPSKPATKPLTPEQSMMNMLMQQSQGEQKSNSNMLLQYLLLMDAMKPATSSASSPASSMTPTAVSTISEATSTSASIPATGISTQAISSTEIPPINGTPASFQSNLIRSNSSDIKVSFSGMSSKLGLPSNHAANQNSLRLKRLLLNRLLANSRLRLKQIRFFHEKNKETIITAANASSSAKSQLKTVPLNTTVPTTKLANTEVSTGINPQVPIILPTAPNTSTVRVPTTTKSVNQSSVSKSQTKLSPPAQPIGREKQQHPALSITTQMPLIHTTAPLATIQRLTQPLTSNSVTPREQNSASTAKNWRYPNYPHMASNGHHQHQSKNSIIYQNQQPYQYQNQNQIQYQPVNQAPILNYQMAQYSNQAPPAYQSNQGQYPSVAYPNQNVAYPNQNVAYPNQNVAYPNQNVAYPNQNVVHPNPSMGYDPIYAYQQPVGHNEYQGFPQPHQMQFPVPGRSSFPMPSDPLLTQVNPPADPMLPIAPPNAISAIDSAEARAEYLEQNPPTEQPPPVPTTPAPVTTTSTIKYIPRTNPNLLRNARQKSSNQWAEMLHFLSKNFPDYLSLRSQVHQTALSSPMAKQFRTLIAAKSKVANPLSGNGFGTSRANANLGSHWINTTPSTTPAGEPLEVEIEFEPTTTTPSPIHPLHAAKAAAARGFEIAKSVNGQIFGGMFGPPIQQRQSNVNSNFDMFGMMTGHKAAQSNGFHGPPHNTRQGNQHAAFFTNGHNPGNNKAPWTHNQNSKWGMNGAV